MYAVIVSGGKQYKVEQGKTLEVELLSGNPGDKINLPVVLFCDGDAVLAGDEAAKKIVSAEIVSHGKAKKIVVYKYKPKKNIRKKQGHRQPFTLLKVVSIS